MRDDEKDLTTEIGCNALVTGACVLPVFIIVGGVLELSWRYWVGWIFLYVLFMAAMGVYEELNRRLMRIQEVLRRMEEERTRQYDETEQKLNWLRDDVQKLRPSSRPLLNE